MGYTLQAIVARNGTFSPNTSDGLEVIELGSGYEMIPLVSMALERIGVPFCPFTDEGYTDVPQALDLLCARLSRDGPVAYIEAEIFGGAGTQANALYSNGRLAQPIAKSSEAINDALRWLGVKVQGNRDEFDTLGLGRHRSTDRWLS